MTFDGFSARSKGLPDVMRWKAAAPVQVRVPLHGFRGRGVRRRGTGDPCSTAPRPAATWEWVACVGAGKRKGRLE